MGMEVRGFWRGIWGVWGGVLGTRARKSDAIRPAGAAVFTGRKTRRGALGRAAGGRSGSSGRGAGTPVEDHPPIRRELVQEVEIPDVGGQHAGAEPPRLQKDQRIIKEFSLVPCPARQAAQAKQRAGEQAGLAPHAALWRVQAPPGNVGDDPAKRGEGRLGRWVGRVQPPEGMRQLGEADGRMMTDPIGKEPVRRGGCAALQGVEIDARIEQQRATDQGRGVGPA